MSRGTHSGLTWLIRGLTLLAPVAFVVLTLGSRGGAEVAEAGMGYRPAERPVQRLTIREGEALDGLLARGGLGHGEVRRLVELSRPYVDWRRPDPSMNAAFHAWPGETPVRIELRADRDMTLRFEIEGAVWNVSADSVAVRKDTVVVAGRIASTLWSAELEGDAARLSTGEKADLAGHLADVFAWQLDFFRQVRPGDTYRIALERDVRPDGSVRRARVLAAEYVTAGERFTAYRFRPSAGAAALYYDELGVALRGAFLKAPLDLVRITSRFSSSRFHPVLGRYRSHNGVDYGAAAGTPVRATGDGRVVRAGWSGEYGLLVEVDHAGGIRTRYAHLSGVANGIRPGAAVEQSDLIGVVGATGLATGPHLHYEFLVHGRPVDPSSVDLPVARPIPDNDRERFELDRFASAALLERAPRPGGEAPGP